MINFKELRCGNLINKRDKLFIVDQKNMLTIARNPTAYSAIPLTEEILLKCGFDKIGGVTSFYNGYFELIFNVDHISITVEGQWLSLDIKYLHQLQNLYFSLTGQELNTSELL